MPPLTPAFPAHVGFRDEGTIAMNLGGLEAGDWTHPCVVGARCAGAGDAALGSGEDFVPVGRTGRISSWVGDYSRGSATNLETTQRDTRVLAESRNHNGISRKGR